LEEGRQNTGQIPSKAITIANDENIIQEDKEEDKEEDEYY